MAAGASLVAAGAFGWYLVAAEDERATAVQEATATERFVAELRSQPAPSSLRRTSDADLVALGERFCDGLRRTGSSLRVVFEDQLAGRVYDGQSQVVAAARRHLCPDLPDRDA